MLAVSPSICEALAADRFQGCISAFNIVETVRRTVVPAEVKLVGIALQMLRRNAMKRACKAAFEDGEG